MSSYILKINKNSKKIKEFNSENIYEFIIHYLKGKTFYEL